MAERDAEMNGYGGGKGWMDGKLASEGGRMAKRVVGGTIEGKDIRVCAPARLLCY
jgi:hypothetical protein